LEQYHETAYYYWYNRLRKLKRAKNPDADKIAAVSEAFEIFRKEAVKRKGMMKKAIKAMVNSTDKDKRKKSTEYTLWLAEQRNVIDKLME
jgi:hypothetical protein